MERNSGIHEYINSETHFFLTPRNAPAFIAIEIQQQQQMLQYFLHSRLNLYAIPYVNNNILPVHNQYIPIIM